MNINEKFVTFIPSRDNDIELMKQYAEEARDGCRGRCIKLRVNKIKSAAIKLRFFDVVGRSYPTPKCVLQQCDNWGWYSLVLRF